MTKAQGTKKYVDILEKVYQNRVMKILKNGGGMRMKHKIAQNSLEYMIVIAFIMNVFANVLSFYATGNKNDSLRTVISWSVMITMTVCLIFYIIYEFCKNKEYDAKRNILISLLPGIFGGVC